MNDCCCMEALETAGRMIIEYGGETYRVEETVTRMGHCFGLDTIESFAVPSGLFISFRREDGRAESTVVRIRSRGTDLSRVNAVNAVSRQCVEQGLSPEEALRRLKAITKQPAPSAWLQIGAAALSSSGFTLMFGGSPLDMALALVAAALVQAMNALPERYRMGGMISALMGSFFSALLPTLFHALTGLGHLDLAIAGALMPLLPGLAMTNAVQDAFRGDMISAVSHAMRATMTAVMVAGGALLATTLYGVLGGMF